MRTMLRATLLFGSSLLAACGPKSADSSQPPASPAAPAPPVSAGSTPSVAAGGARRAPDLPLFAEGWGLALGDVRGATVIYDHYVMGLGRVQGDQVELLPLHSVPRTVGYRVGGAFGSWPTNLWIEVKYPGTAPELRRWTESDWGSSYGTTSITYENYQQVQFTAGTEAGSRALLSGLSEARIAPVARTISWDDPANCIVDRRLRAEALRTNDRGDVVVAGTLGSAVAVESWTTKSDKGVVRKLEELPSVPKDWRTAVSLCAGPSRRMYLVRDAWAESGMVPKPLERKVHVVGSAEGQWKLLGEVPVNQTRWMRLVECVVSTDGALWTALAARGGPSELIRLGPEGKWATVTLASLPPLPTLPQFQQSGPKRSWRRVDVRITPQQDFELTALHAASTGEVWAVGQRTAGGNVMEVTGVPYTSYLRTAVFRSGPARSGGTLLWEQTVGSVLDAAPVPIGDADVAPLLPPPKPPPAPAGSRAAPPPSVASPPASPPPSAPPARQPSKAVVAATPSCQSVFVALYTVQAATPADYDFPQTKTVLRGRTEFSGVTFVEVRLGDRRVFGALTSSYDVGKRLADFIETKVSGSSPQLFCGEPAILRTVSMDLERASESHK
jgi:hypothetical protein